MAIYTRNETCAPIRAEEGITGVLCPPRSSTQFRDLPKDQQIGGYPRPGQLSGIVEDSVLDSEGRCVILEFPAFVLLGVYSPANRDESRDDFRTCFFEALDVRIRNLVAEGKQVILTGDLNVIRSERDATNVQEAIRKADMDLETWISLPTRRIFNQLIFEGTFLGDRDEDRANPVLWDLCRNFHPDRVGMNTCWDTKRNTRPANNGSRIDYILCTDGIKKWFTFADIQEGLMGSDHCPVFATLSGNVLSGEASLPLSDLVNPPGVFDKGKRLRQLGQKDLLSLSARLIPEFDRRQSIRDMFTKPARPSTTPPTAFNSESSKLSEENTSQETTTDIIDPRTTLAQDEAFAAALAASEHAAAVGNSNSQQQKRSSDALLPNSRQAKRSKSATEPASLKSKSSAGQQTLRGFFKPAASTTGAQAIPDSQNDEFASAMSAQVNRKMFASPNKSSNAVNASASSASPATTTPKMSANGGAKQESPPSPDRVFDPIEAKESWSKLLGKRIVPRCEHNEPCISLLTKKAGVNRGK